MKNMFKMVCVLALICVLAGGLLAMIDRVTKEPIARALREEKMKAVRNVLPEHDNDPMSCTNVVVENGQRWVFHVATKNGKYAGAAFEASSDQGYSGTIRIMAGVKADNTVRGIRILEHSETPGLGARITESEFIDQFRGKDVEKTVWKVRSDSGDIDAITGATISPQAVLEALNSGLDVYIRHRDKITAAAALEPGKE